MSFLCEIFLARPFKACVVNFWYFKVGDEIREDIFQGFQASIKENR